MKYAPYSSSRIKTFLDCPRKFKYLYIDKIPGGYDPIFFKTGRIGHEIKEEYTRHCVCTKQHTDLSFLIETVRKNKISEYPEHKTWIIQFCEQIKSLSVDYENIIGIEEDVIIDFNFNSVPDWNGAEAFLRARLDENYVIADGNIVIRDLKTGFKVEVNTFQLKFYAWLIWLRDNRAYYTIHGENLFINTFLCKVSERVEFTNFEAIHDYFMGLITSIETETKFEPTPQDSMCSYCPFVRQCTQELFSGEKQLSIPEKFIADTPEKVMDLIHIKDRLKALQENIDEVVRKWVTDNGSIPVGADKEYRFISVEKKEVMNNSVMFETLKNLSADPMDFISFNMTKLNKEIKKHPELMELLSVSFSQQLRCVNKDLKSISE